MRLLFAIFIALFSGGADATEWGKEFDKLIARPGTKVILRKDRNGSPVREIRLKSGVVFIQSETKGKVQSAGIDNSGAGAVLCTTEFLVVAKHADQACFGGRSKIGPAIDQALDRIAGFVAANSLEPITKAEAVEQQRSTLRFYQSFTARLSKNRPDELCNPQTSTALSILASFEKAGRASLKTTIDKLLAIPRPPVLNPCM